MTRRLALLLLLGCGQRAAETPVARPLEEPYRGSFSPRPTATAEAVAEVNGERIWDVDVAAYARDHQLEPRAALEELIAVELLAQEARRRGLAEDPEVLAVRRRERVRRLVDEFDAASDTPADIPASDVDVVWKQHKVQRAMNHGPVHEAGWVRIPASRKLPPAELEAARRTAEEMRAVLVRARPASYAEFQRVADEFHRKQTGKPVHTEAPFQVDERAAADPGFKQAALALRAPGQISPVTRTRWGWDVLYLVTVHPGRSTTREQADAEIRGKMHDDWRPVAFRRWLEGFVAPAKIGRNDPVLERVEVDSTFGLP